REAVLKVSVGVLKDVEVARTDTGGVIRVGGRPLSELRLHTDDITRTVPRVARFEPVREVVRQIQRRVIAEGPTILAGRDIGTVVAPEAKLKLYLDVSLQERAARKLWAQNAEELRTQSEVELQLAERDRIELASGEYPHEALIREVREETGLAVRVASGAGLEVRDEAATPLPMPIAIQEIRISPSKEYLDFVYFCHVTGGEVSLDYRAAR